jgi:hypothetical protein
MISYYRPLVDNEQEALLRMIEGQDAYVEIEGWGFHSAPKITAGDKRLQVRFQLEFSKPAFYQVAVRELTLVLRLRDGREVFRDTKSVVYSGQPLMVQAGVCLDLVWDMALDSISQDFLDIFLPGFKGKKVMEIKNGEVVKHG